MQALCNSVIWEFFIFLKNVIKNYLFYLKARLQGQRERIFTVLSPKWSARAGLSRSQESPTWVQWPKNLAHPPLLSQVYKLGSKLEVQQPGIGTGTRQGSLHHGQGLNPIHHSTSHNFRAFESSVPMMEIRLRNDNFPLTFWMPQPDNRDRQFHLALLSVAALVPIRPKFLHFSLKALTEE